MENKIPSLQTLCIRKIRGSILRGEKTYARRIHRCPIEFQDNLLSLCTPKQLKAAERGSEKSKIDLDTSAHWKALCKRDFNCDKKPPDITWDIKYELLNEEKKRTEEEAKALIENSHVEKKGAPMARVVKERDKSVVYTKKRSTASKTKMFVLPSGKLCRCGVNFLK